MPDLYIRQAKFANVTIDERGRAMTEWLAPIDSSDNHETAVNAQKLGTGSWFIESDNFQRWRRNFSNSFLWISGFRKFDPPR